MYRKRQKTITHSKYLFYLERLCQELVFFNQLPFGSFKDFCEALSHSIYNLFRLTFSNVPMLISFDSGTEKYYLHMGLKQNPSKSIKKTIEKKYSIRSSMAFRSRYSKALTLKHFFHKKIRLDFKTSQIHNKRLIICSKYQ